MTHSHFQALGSTQAPVNSFHLLSSARPLTLCSHLSGSHHCLAETGPQPSPHHWLCRWGINPSAMPVPTRSVGKAPGWAAPQITVRSLLPSCGLTRLLGSVLLPSTWTAELLFACQGKDRPKKTCQGPNQCSLRGGATGGGTGLTFVREAVCRLSTGREEEKA